MKPITPAERAEIVGLTGRALHSAGSPSHRIEEGMTLATRGLGLDGHFFSTPTALFASFEGDAGRTTLLERHEPSEVNLARLRLLDDLMDDLDGRRVEPEALRRRLREIETLPSRWGPVATVLAFALASAGAARFLGGGWDEILGGLGVGLMTGLIAAATERSQALGRTFEPAAALMAALGAAALAGVWPDLSVGTVTLAGVIVLVPGLTLTTAMTELATRHLVSGSARLAGAGVVFLGLVFGAAVGARLSALIFDPVAAAPPAAPDLALDGLALLLAATGFTVLFRADLQQAPWILLAGAIAIASVRVGNQLLGPELGPFVGATVVGVAGNLYARLLRRPAATIHVTGLILLVPGSLGFRGLSDLLAEDVLSGVHSAFAAAMVAVALTTGMLLASVLVPPRRVL